MVTAMGPRPIFDFPDQVILNKTPLKIETFVLITIHNVGLVNAGFTINTRWYVKQIFLYVLYSQQYHTVCAP